MAKSNLLTEVSNTIRRKHMSYSTEKTYLYWIKTFIRLQATQTNIYDNPAISLSI